MNIKGSTRTLNSSQREQILDIIEDYTNIEDFEAFSLISEDCSAINNFKYFSSLVKRKAAVYNSLLFLVHQLGSKMSSSEGNRRAGALSGNLKALESSSHLSIHNRFQFRLKQAFEEVSRYLDEIKENKTSRPLPASLTPTLSLLQFNLDSDKPLIQKIQSVDSELQKIAKTVQKELHQEMANTLGTRSQIRHRIEQKLIPKATKSVTTTPVNEIGIRAEEEDTTQNLHSLVLDEVEAEFDASQQSSTLMSKDKWSTFICFSSKNSFLSTLYRYGLTLKKDGKLVYSKQLEDEMRYLMDVVFCKGSYYIYCCQPGLLVRKKNDASEPYVWWDKHPINRFDGSSKVLRASPCQSALIVNPDPSHLLVIQVNKDGSPAKELLINNHSEARINCHEPLLKGRILTVNRKGLFVVYQTNWSRLTTSTETCRLQLLLNTDEMENCFYLTSCPRSEYIGVLVRNRGETKKASRILVYKLRMLSTLNDQMILMAEMDLWGKGLLTYHSICFSHYIGGLLMLCGQSSNGSKVFRYVYDVGRRVLYQKDAESLGEGDRACYKLARFGKEINGILSGGKILNIKFLARIL